MSLKRARTAPASFGRSLKHARSNVGRAGVRSFRSSVPRKLPTKLSPSLRSAIKAVITNQKEKKLDVILPTGTQGQTAIAFVDNGGANGPSFYNLMPAPMEGTTNNDRVGNEIMVSQSKLRLTIRAGAVTDLITTPCIVTLMIGRLKNKTSVPSDADWGNMFYSIGTSAQGAESATLTSMMYPVNDDAWDISLRRQYKVGVVNAVGFHNNDFNASYTDEIDIGKFMKKKLHFDNGSVVCENEGLYMWLWWNTLDGSTLSGALRPHIVATVSTRYSDA